MADSRGGRGLPHLSDPKGSSARPTPLPWQRALSAQLEFADLLPSSSNSSRAIERPGPTWAGASNGPAQLSGQSFLNLHHIPDLDSRDANLQSPPAPSKTSPALFPFSRLVFLSPSGQALFILYDSTPALPSLLQDAILCYPHQGPL